jgi:ribosome production factor 1
VNITSFQMQFSLFRYIFKNEKRVDIQEIGPRFCLKLQWLQSGVYDKNGDYEFVHRQELDTSRKRFHL